MKELQESNSRSQNQSIELKIKTLEKSLNEMKRKLGIPIMETSSEPGTPKSPTYPPIMKKEMELKLPSSKEKNPGGGVKFSHMVIYRVVELVRFLLLKLFLTGLSTKLEL